MGVNFCKRGGAANFLKLKNLTVPPFPLILKNFNLAAKKTTKFRTGHGKRA